MAASTINLSVEAGATFNHQMQWMDANKLPINMTGCTARSHWKTTLNDVVPLKELTTENGGIVINIPTGTITLHLTATETALIPYVDAIYDLEIIFPPDSTGEITVVRLAKGKVKISREVTK